MRQYGNKVGFTINVDADIKRLFVQRYPGLSSYMMETYMRDMLRVAVEENNVDLQNSEDVDKVIEEVVAEKHKLNIKLQALEIQKRECGERQKKSIEDRKKEQELLDAETFAHNEIMKQRLGMDFKLAQEKASKDGRTITACEFLSLGGK